MHNEVRVDPDNEIAEVNELNNLATDDTTVGVGDADKGAFNQLTITKTQTSPVGRRLPVATNGTLIYNLHVDERRNRPGQQRRGQGLPARPARGSSRRRTPRSGSAALLLHAMMAPRPVA